MVSDCYARLAALALAAARLDPGFGKDALDLARSVCAVTAVVVIERRTDGTRPLAFGDGGQDGAQRRQQGDDDGRGDRVAVAVTLRRLAGVYRDKAPPEVHRVPF